MKTFVMTLAVIIATSIVATAQKTAKILPTVKESFVVKFPGIQVKKFFYSLWQIDNGRETLLKLPKYF